MAKHSDDLTRLLKYLRRCEFYLQQYDEPLRRYRDEQREIKNALIETYPHFWHSEEDDDDERWRHPLPPRPVVSRWTPDNRHVRPAIRASLDYLNRKWAPEITKHKKLKAIVRGVKAEIKILQKAHR